MIQHPTPKRFGSWFSAAMCVLVGLLLWFGALLEAWQYLTGSRSIIVTTAPLSVWAWLGFVLMGLICLLGGWILYGLGVEYLVTGPQGIEKHGMGFVYHISWENIERVGLLGKDIYSINPQANARTEFMLQQLKTQPGVVTSAFGKLLTNPPLVNLPEGLVLRQPVTVEKQPWGWGITNQVAFLDLSDFSNWRYGKLGQEIRRYAPHLL